MNSWFNDSAMRSIVRNTSFLGLSKGTAALATLNQQALAAISGKLP